MLRIQAEALTFDDVSLVPAHSTVLPKDVSLATQLTRGLKLNLPIVAAAMDTVTEARLAIAMAQLGGIGILHKNMSVAQQAGHVSRVKQFEAGVIRSPFTVRPDTTIGEVLKLTRARNISGVPVVDGSQLVGIVMLANLQIGYFMPPAGMDLFIAAYRFKVGILALARACLPFFLIVGASLLLITWIPWLSLAFL